jgi:hypothetical protein
MGQGQEDRREPLMYRACRDDPHLLLRKAAQVRSAQHTDSHQRNRSGEV